MEEKGSYPRNEDEIARYSRKDKLKWNLISILKGRKTTKNMEFEKERSVTEKILKWKTNQILLLMLLDSLKKKNETMETGLVLKKYNVRKLSRESNFHIERAHLVKLAEI